MRISKKLVYDTIDRAEQAYLNCWDVLMFFKCEKEKMIDDIISFQIILARTIYDLSELNHKVKWELKRIRKNRKQYTKEWFVAREKSFDMYCRVIDKTIELGKCLGDSFAWVFFIKDAELIKNNFQHPPVSAPAPGLGMKSEISFLEKFRNHERYFFIYHGITSFLRVGDVSIFDRQYGRVIGVGEIKSGKVTADGSIPVHVEFISKVEMADINGHEHLLKTDIEFNMTEDMHLRLEKQIKQMKNSLQKKIPDRKMDINTQYCFKEIEQAYLDMNKNDIGYVVGGKGILICLSKNPGSTLSKRIFNKNLKTQKKLLDSLVQNTLKIVTDEYKDNRLIYSHFSLNLMPGATPFFWWHLDNSIIKKVIFDEISMWVIFNPGYLISKLREMGFDIVFHKDEKFQFVPEMVFNNRIIEVKNMSFFVDMILWCLMKEEFILQVIETIVSDLKEGKHPDNSKIMIDITQHLLY